VTEPVLRQAAVAAVCALTLAVVACSTDDQVAVPGPSTDDSVSSTTDGSTTTASTEPEPDVSLEWESCGGGLECARLEVPVDHDEQRGDSIKLDLVRQPADDLDTRIGSLVVNPGGPGSSAVELVESLGPSLPEAITDRFDIVGFDPRGVGGTRPLDCGSNVVQMYDADPTPDDADDVTALLDESEEFVDECEAGHGELLAHLGTRDVARDMDLVREALGEETISYLGYSYGTSIGQVYADLFPERVRAMVLDGAVELGVPGVQAAAFQAVGFERAFDRFVGDCEADPGCPIGDDPEGAVEEVAAAAEEDPIPAAGADRPATPGVVSLGLTLALYSESRWPDLAEGVAAALDGDATILVSLADDYLDIGSFPVYFAVSCLDSSWPETPEELLFAGKLAAAGSPHFGEAIVTDYVRCPLWPVEPQPLTPPTADGSPPIVVVSTTNDPATPYESGVRVAEQLPEGVLVTNEGDGHTVVAQGEECIDDAVFAYLVDLSPPPDGLRCP
jgi:pimeloyl-ACP methyl ester carboxylesterase